MLLSLPPEKYSRINYNHWVIFYNIIKKQENILKLNIAVTVKLMFCLLFTRD